MAGESDDAVRRIVMTTPIPDRLIRNLAVANDVPRYLRKYSARRARLTPALWETLKLVAAGYGPGRIASELGIRETTADDRVKRLLSYFDARDRMELVVRCYREGII